MKPKISFINIPEKLFYILFCTFPLLVPVVHSFTKYSKYTYGEFAIMLILTIIVCSFFILSCKNVKINIKTEVLLIFGLFLISALLRLFCIPLMQTAPISDFMQAHTVAQMGKFPNVPFNELVFNQIYYKQFPSWGGWMLTLKFIYKIFGAKVIVAQYLNVFISSATVVLIYLATKNIMKSRRVAMIAALLFAFWPSMIIYTGVLTPEHFANFACVLVLLFLSYAHQYRDSNFKLSAIFYVLAGVSAGILQMYKAISAILIVAFFIAELFIHWLPDLVSVIKKNLKVTQMLKKMAIVSAAFVFSYIIFIQSFYLVLSNFIGTKIETLNAASMYMGMDVNSQGRWNKQTTQLRNDLIVEYQDMDKVNEKFSSMLKDMIKKNYQKYPELFQEKIKRAWSGHFPEDDLFKWASNNTITVPKDVVYYNTFYKNIKQQLGNISAHYYYLIMFFAAIACIGYVFKKNNYTIFFCSLYIFGLALTLLISEVQQRYKTIVYAPLAILAAVGIYFSYTFLDSLYYKIKKLYLQKRETKLEKI